MEAPLVSIGCITYNHAPYIRQCLEGFLMQKTTFPFEIIINDDCSTDGTTEIVKEYADKYPDLIIPIFHEENQYQKGVRGIYAKFVYPKVRGKYIALCEGDDYWIDPLKLQKQVDFLESHLDYGLIHSYFHYVDENGEIIPPPTRFYRELQGRIFDGYIWDYYLINSGFILTCTTMFRSTLYHLNEKTFLDHGLFMMIARQSKIYCLREITAAYRRNPAGAMCTASAYYSNLCQRAILYQLHYFLDGAPSNIYYKNNKLVAYRINMAYTYSLIKSHKVLPKEDRIILIDIARKNFYLLLKVPFCLARIVAKKMLKS